MKKLTAVLLCMGLGMFVVGCGESGGAKKPETKPSTPPPVKAPEKK